MRMHTIMQHKIKRQNAAENPMMKFPVFFLLGFHANLN